MKNNLLAYISILAIIATSCGKKDDESKNTNSTPSTTEMEDQTEPLEPSTTPEAEPKKKEKDTEAEDPQVPAKPEIGAQIDRNGRPAINTALNNAFTNDLDKAKSEKDRYNSADDESTWADDFQAEIQFNLGVLDALDGTCGNQFQVGTESSDDPDRYSGLASVLANDRLWVDSTSGSCENGYLGVELTALGITEPGSCGGRALATDVVDITYSVVVNGSLGDIPDGVSSPDDFSTSFPYMASPVQ